MSRFISADSSSTSQQQQDEQDSRWRAAQAAIDATRTKPRLEPGSQEGGKSLYETLQANKEKKQALYEESLRITNQFQSLDEDDVEFLDSVLESTRAKEAALKRDTKAQLEAFRAQQQELEKSAASASGTNAVKQDGHGPDEQTTWAVNRKRKKGENKVLPLGGVKLRKTSSSMGEREKETAAAAAAETTEQSQDNPNPSPTLPVEGSPATPAVNTPPSKIVAASPSAPPATTPSTSLGLGAYSSSDEDD